ncbi:MAG: glutamine-hydrolyzing carbamoyl-phosphate synthase small subunit, partial [Actinomycetota bacterium]|nr:glutamine-hydrolyzing carbamoyl-phosphate synthase small subunit [Actinomycetota bacterium]
MTAIVRRAPSLTAAALVLADGSTFEGQLLGAVPYGGAASGEVVFNTALSGYQEVLTDPSYAGQIISFTYPHIGNYGVNPQDAESRGTFARGVVVRDLARRHSNHRATEDLESFLVRHGLTGIGGVDTRRLTRILRSTGALCGAIGATEGPGAVDASTLRAAAAAEPGTSGVDLVAQVTTDQAYVTEARSGAPHGRSIVAFDFGIKTRIIYHLAGLGRVEVVPASTSAADVLARDPDGVFLSNGPGDPEMATAAIDAVKGLVGAVPIFGICLGHQILSLAIGGSTEKLPFGHHGSNQHD